LWNKEIGADGIARLLAGEQLILDFDLSLVSGKNESKNRLVTPMGGDALG
jgi:hypothetical protein